MVAAAGEARSSATDRRAALVEILAKRGLSATANDVVFLDDAKGALGAAVSTSRAFVIARVTALPNDPSELYLVETRLSPNGVLLDVTSQRDISDTTGAEETSVVAQGARVAFVSKSLDSALASTVTLLDFRGQKPLDWPLMDRAKNAITNYQETGQLRGVERHRLQVKAKGAIEISMTDGELDVRADGKLARLTFDTMSLAEKASWISVLPNDLARPGNLTTWSVDRVRNVIGDDTMQWIKATYFTMQNYVASTKANVTGDTGAAGIAEDLGEDLAAPHKVIPVDPDLGWPPPPLEIVVTPSLPGEGEWKAKDDTNWFRQQPNLATTFITTFIRTDKTQKNTRVYIALWDPRQVELHMMCGTVEPKGATGDAGPGLIPRTPDVMKRLVAASNAGFQAQHGEFGMMADGVVYLPPKPYAATVAELNDGSTAFGTWPESPVIPDNILSYRQNMTAIVQDGKFNPFGRTWWGGTPPGQEDTTHTVRTGICLTKEKFVGYFYGAELSPEALAQAMIQARCSYGIALDMNAGHAGMEFYKVGPESEVPLLDAIDGSFEAQGAVPDMDGWNFRGRKLINGMGLMNFPRYIKREGRDFFYLTLRHVIPGENIAPVIDPPKEGEGAWTLKGLPQHGFPYALALTEVRPDKANPALSLKILEVDPRTVVVGGPQDGEDKTVLLLDGGAKQDSDKASLYYAAKTFIISDKEAPKGASRIASGDPDATTGAAIVGLNDDSGMLFYAEVSGTADRSKTDLKSARELMTRLGCSQLIVLQHPLDLAMGGTTSLANEAIRPPSGKTAVKLIRTEAPDGRRFFEDTPIVPKDTWYSMQQYRVRYVHKHD